MFSPLCVCVSCWIYSLTVINSLSLRTFALRLPAFIHSLTLPHYTFAALFSTNCLLLNVFVWSAHIFSCFSQCQAYPANAFADFHIVAFSSFTCNNTGCHAVNTHATVSSVGKKIIKICVHKTVFIRSLGLGQTLTAQYIQVTNETDVRRLPHQIDGGQALWLYVCVFYAWADCQRCSVHWRSVIIFVLCVCAHTLKIQNNFVVCLEAFCFISPRDVHEFPRWFAGKITKIHAAMILCFFFFRSSAFAYIFVVAF